MTKEQYLDFCLRYKGCGACFPMYHTLSRFEKMWFSAIQKDVTELQEQIEQLQKTNSAQKEILKKVRVALIQERTANIMNYGKGGVEMFDSLFEVLKGVSN